MAARTKLPVQLVKDTAAACVAELVAGRGREMRSFLYVFVDTFIGGGLVIDSHLHAGLQRQRRRGGLDVHRPAPDGDGAPPQLLGVASLINLEALYRERGLDAGAVGDDARAAAALARGHRTPGCGAGRAGHRAGGAQRRLPARPGRRDRRRLVRPRVCWPSCCARWTRALGRHSWEGVTRPALLAGTIGSDARAIGGALLPLYAAYAPDSDLFLKIES